MPVLVSPMRMRRSPVLNWTRKDGMLTPLTSVAIHRFAALTTAIVVVALGGCGGPPPLDLPAVEGVVRTRSGDALSAGLIEFRNVADPNKRSTGAIDSQGNFSLTTGEANVRRPGAHPGDYEVAAYEPISFAKRSAAELVTVPPEGLQNLEVVVGDPAQ